MVRRRPRVIAPPGTWAELPSLPRVVLVGRPNVGKSSLFNRVIGEAKAVVAPEPGVTRDPLVAVAEWAGARFLCEDTGGVADPEAGPDAFTAVVGAKAMGRLEAAAVIVLVVDGQVGIVPEDGRIADLLRTMRRPVMVWVNKCEGHPDLSAAFYPLGFGDPWPVSAIHGEGLGDALDAVVQRLTIPSSDEQAEPSPEIRIAVVGRPNAGKSSLCNRLAATERLIVSPLAGTTRDAVDLPFVSNGRPFLLVDTPGLRRPSRVDRGSVEWESAQRSVRAIERCQVAVLLLDGTEPLTEQDKRIAGRIADAGRAVVVAVNKVDLLPGVEGEEAVRRVTDELPFMGYALVVRISAKTGQGTTQLMAAIDQAATAFRLRVPTPQLNRCVRQAVAFRPPAPSHGKMVRILYAAQIRSEPPAIALVVSQTHVLPSHYLRYLENRLRQDFSLQGTPVRLLVRARSRRHLQSPARHVDR